MRMFRTLVVLSVAAGLLSVGCTTKGLPSRVRGGIPPRDAIDAPAQVEAFDHLRQSDLVRHSDRVRATITELVRSTDPRAFARPTRHVLCLSGGGSHGAFSVGVLNGWTQSGARPRFDVVTGISTGALIAPLAFLGPQYDETLRRIFTTSENGDVFRARPIRGLFCEGLADTTPLSEQIDQVVTPELIREIACEHAKGRRLYVGTTELASGRLVVWDIGAIATRGDCALVKKVLLGSSAIPGLFPPAHIRVNIDGREFEELHGDGAISASLFFRPAYLPPKQRSESMAANLYGTKVWCIVAGKLFPDSSDFRANVLKITTNSIATQIHAQTRSNLDHVFHLCLLNGMEYNAAVIPDDYQGLPSNQKFDPAKLAKVFELGRRLACSGRAWRRTPPGFVPSEAAQERTGTCLTLDSRVKVVEE